MNPYILFGGGFLVGVIIDRLQYKFLRKPTPEVEAEIERRIKLALEERGYEEMDQQELRDRRIVHERVSSRVSKLLGQKRHEARVRNASTRTN